MNDEERIVDSLTEKINAKGKPLFVRNTIRTNKYTILTFLPLNLFHQFSRLANFYFLIIVSLLQFDWAPISASAALVPLTIVIGISAIREAIEDYFRWRSDQKINALPTKRVECGRFTECRWDQLHVGDIIYCEKDEQIPADIVFLASNDPNGTAYIDTCNLDGESNLKIRQAIKQTKDMHEPSQYEMNHIQVSCDLPNNRLYSFNGNLTIGDKQYPLDNSSLLLRGCKLKNTHYAIGLVVYCGQESKIMKNSCDARTKRSQLERGLNWKLLSVFVIIFGFAFTASFFGYFYEQDMINKDKVWYFYRNDENKRNPPYAFFILFVSHIIIINAMVPISLYVTLEVVRVFQAGFVAWDVEMYDIETKSGCVPRTTNISDDLGQIRYVFSDKTGTLTKNVMDFMKCSVGGVVYGSGVTEVGYAAARRQGIDLPPPKPGQSFEDDAFVSLIQSDSCPEIVQHFLWLLSTCHNVIPEPDETCKHGIAFQAPSPDEGALVEAAADLGYVFCGKDIDSLTIKVNGTPMKVEVLANLEFTSERKRSSIVIRHPITGDIIVYTKGADDTILSRLESHSYIEETTREHLQQFSDSGLRTLCIAYRILNTGWAEEWALRLKSANCLVNGREEAVAKIAEEVECKLTLIGATAIEDKLQESVSDAIDSMLRAGIHVWVITGDKRETAINIGYACSLLSSDMTIATIDEATIVKDLENAERVSSEIALVITGGALPALLDTYVDKFVELTLRCRSVICCRVSPIQKAQIVEVMREKTKRMAIAIGDGANDVGMILKADVGIGISGKEGRQAVLAADYSIAKFKYIKRLLLVHGRLNLYRNIECIYYSFYKNMVFTFNQIIYGVYSHFSGTTMFDSVLYTLYNVFFTSAPIVVYSGADRDVSMEAMMETPELFDMDGKRDWLQSYPRFLLNMLLGIAHSFVAFFVSFLICMPFESPDGMGITQQEFAATVYQVVVAIVTVRIASLCNYWTWMHWFFIWGSALIFPIIYMLIDYMNLSYTIKHLTIRWLRMPHIWLAMVAGMLVVGIPIVLQTTIERGRDSLKNRILYKEKLRQKFKKMETKQLQN